MSIRYYLVQFDPITSPVNGWRSPSAIEEIIGNKSAQQVRFDGTSGVSLLAVKSGVTCPVGTETTEAGVMTWLSGIDRLPQDPLADPPTVLTVEEEYADIAAKAKAME